MSSTAWYFVANPRRGRSRSGTSQTSTEKLASVRYQCEGEGGQPDHHAGAQRFDPVEALKDQPADKAEREHRASLRQEPREPRALLRRRGLLRQRWSSDQTRQGREAGSEAERFGLVAFHDRAAGEKPG